jgi:hypothetical protein
MMIDRRDFIARATLVFIAPAIRLLPSQQPSSAARSSRVVCFDPWVERSR